MEPFTDSALINVRITTCCGVVMLWCTDPVRRPLAEFPVLVSPSIGLLVMVLTSIGLLAMVLTSIGGFLVVTRSGKSSVSPRENGSKSKNKC